MAATTISGWEILSCSAAHERDVSVERNGVLTGTWRPVAASRATAAQPSSVEAADDDTSVAYLICSMGSCCCRYAAAVFGAATEVHVDIASLGQPQPNQTVRGREHETLVRKAEIAAAYVACCREIGATQQHCTCEFISPTCCDCTARA